MLQATAIPVGRHGKKIGGIAVNADPAGGVRRVLEAREGPADADSPPVGAINRGRPFTVKAWCCAPSNGRSSVPLSSTPMHSCSAPLALALAVTACQPRPTPPPGDGAGPSCPPAAAAPQLTPAPAVKLPSSRVTVLGEVEKAHLERELAARIPLQLASGQEHLGLPGRLTFVVRRGPLTASLVDEALEVRTSVSVTAQVCKPLGPLCPVYGTCHPKLDARASLPLLLDREYALGKSQVSAAVLQGCTIAGFDATGEVRRAATDAVAETRQRIDRELPDLRPQMAAAWEAMHQRLPLDGGDCLRVVPRSISQRRPQLEGEVLRLGATVAGELSLQRPCATSSPPPAPLPPLTTGDEFDDDSELVAQVRLPWDAVALELEAALAEGDAPAPRSLALVGAQIEGVSRVVIGAVPARGRCATRAWASADPWYDPVSRRLRLRDVVPLPGLGRSQRPDRGLLAALEASPGVALPRSLDRLGERLDEAVAALVPPLVDGLELNLALEPPRVQSVTATADGLVATLAVTGRVLVRAAE